MTSSATNQIAVTAGANLRRARATNTPPLTQRDVAVAVGATEMLVSKWERGIHRPSPTYEAKLAAFLFEGDVSRLYEQVAA
jgi:transcriptional regulator with XRE-family HTH domain